jgi:SAM-dependent methyltransferase
VAEAALATSGLAGRVVALPRNLGKGGAISAGIEQATGRVVAFADADLSTPPEAIARCFELVESGAADVVVTTRHTAESVITERPPVARRLTTTAFQRLLGWRLGLDRYSDTQCGLKAFTGEAARSLFQNLAVQRFAFDVEVLLRAELAGLRVTELPIEWRHVDQSTVRPVRDGARMVIDVMRLRGRLKRWRPTTGDHLPTIAVLERQHWWYVSHRDLATRAVVDACEGLRRHPAELTAVAVGAGTGSMVDRFGELGVDRRVALDPSADAVRFARGPAEHPAQRAASASDRLPLADRSVDVLVALDVLAFLDDDRGALAEFRRVLRPGGTLCVTGPGHQRYWSDYDIALGHRRRYELDDLVAALRTAGLEPARASYFHAWLLPLSFLVNRTPLRRILFQRPERATFVDARINRVLLALDRIERLALGRVDAPTGQAVLAVARRPVDDPR